MRDRGKIRKQRFPTVLNLHIFITKYFSVRYVTNKLKAFKITTRRYAVPYSTCFKKEMTE